MASTRYDVGDVCRATGTFTNVAGAAQDPGTLRFTFEKPDGTQTTYTYPVDAQIVKDAIGIYHVDLSVTRAGRWRYEWVATGIGQTADPGAFEAFADPLAADDDTVVREELEMLTDASSEPVLTFDDIGRLIRRARRPDKYGNVAYAPREGSRTYQLGDRVVPNPRNAHIYECTVAGATGMAPPVWPTGTLATVVDGACTWQEVGADTWRPTYDLNAAAASGWRIKAGRCAPNYSFGIDSSRDMQSDVFTHCMAMADHYTTGGSASAKVPSMVDDFDPATGYGGPLVTGFFDGPFT